MQKEFKELKKAIHNWVEANKGEVSFLGSFFSFDNKGEVKDDMVCGFGSKKCLEIALTELQESLKKEKEFINW